MKTHTQRALGALSLLGLLAMSTSASAAQLGSGTTLPAGQKITENGISLMLSPTSELLVQNASGAILWRSNTYAPCPNSTCKLVMQGDGNLFIQTGIDGNTYLPISYTNGNNGAFLTLSSTVPFVSVGRTGQPPLWTSGTNVATSYGYLPGGFSLAAGQKITVGNVSLELVPNGDVQVRRISTNALLWSTGPFSACNTPTACSLTYTADNALTVNSPTGPAWTTGSLRDPNAQPLAAGNLVVSQFSPYLSILDKNQVRWASGANASSMTYAAGAMGLNASDKRSIGGVTLTLTPQGKVQVIDASNNLDWQSTTADDFSVAADCHQYFQGDGNLVFNAPRNSAGISNTPKGNSNYLHLSTTAPYLTIDNGVHDRIWAASTTQPTPPVRGPAPPVRGNKAQAETVQSFLDTLGVNIHPDQYEFDTAVMLGKIKNIGARVIRGPLPNTPALQAQYRTLADAGVRFNLVSSNTDTSVTLPLIKYVAGLKTGALESVEGVNEINNFGFTYDGFTCRSGGPNNCGGAVAAAQSKLYAAILADSTLRQTVSVYDLTGGTSAVHAARHGLMDIASHADFGTVHPYTYYPDAQPMDTMAKAMNANYNGLTPRAGVVTEMGYTTAKVTPQAQAILSINSWLAGYRLGFVRTFIYELTDGYGEKYGFYDEANQPKPLANAAHNLTALLADAGAPLSPTQTLNWSAPSFTGHSILLQKSDKRFYLILWNEPKVADGTANVAVPTVNHTLNVQRSRKVAVYNPFASTPLVSAQTFLLWPYSWSANSTVSVPIGPNPVVVEITP